MARKIDYDRGVLKRTHPGTGIHVYMYLDQPGVYLSAHGTPLSDAIAEAAGFDVRDLGKKREMLKKMAEAHDAIRREFEQQEARTIVVATKGGFSVVDIGVGRHQVLDQNGEVLTKDALTKELAMSVLDQIAPPEAPLELHEAQV